MTSWTLDSLSGNIVRRHIAMHGFFYRSFPTTFSERGRKSGWEECPNRIFNRRRGRVECNKRRTDGQGHAWWRRVAPRFASAISDHSARPTACRQTGDGRSKLGLRHYGLTGDRIPFFQTGFGFFRFASFHLPIVHGFGVNLANRFRIDLLHETNIAESSNEYIDNIQLRTALTTTVYKSCRDDIELSIKPRRHVVGILNVDER